VESGVTTLLEQAINGAEGMRYMSSSSGNDGSSSITATFKLERSLDIAAVDVQNRASTAQGRLPAVRAADRRHHQLRTPARSCSPMAYFSPDNRYDPLFISNYLDVYVRDSLKRVPGVGDVMIFGERKYAMRLWLDPVRLAKRGLTAVDVTNALAEQNVQVAAGSIGQPPVAGRTALHPQRARRRTPDRCEGLRAHGHQADQGWLHHPTA
jgi:HAE1 family hydrophobic/amphiphilic exporter-1